MKGNRIIWGFVSLVVLTTIAVSFGTMKDILKASPTAQPKNQEEDIKKDFPTVEYENQRLIDEARKIKTQKYGRHQVLFPDITRDTESRRIIHKIRLDY